MADSCHQYIFWNWLQNENSKDSNTYCVLCNISSHRILIIQKFKQMFRNGAPNMHAAEKYETTHAALKSTTRSA